MKNKIKNSKKPDGKLEVSHSHSKAMRKKTRKKSEEKKEKLEEEIKKAEEEVEEDFFEEPVRQIPTITEVSAPVLERIIQRQPLEMQNTIETGQPERETREEGRINYTATNEPNYGFARNTEENEEKKYETTFVPPVLTRREFSEEGMRREFLKPSENVWAPSQDERQLSEIDFIEQETRLPFEEQQKKYKRTKLR